MNKDYIPVGFDDETIAEIIDLLISLSDETKLYFGCDSIKFKKNGQWYGKYATVLVVHKNGQNGCRVYNHISSEIVNDDRQDRPANRMMAEARKVSELYLQMYEFIKGYDIQIHIDVNPDPKFGSSCAAQSAAGFILSMTGVEPKLKPNAMIASHAADGIVRGLHQRH